MKIPDFSLPREVDDDFAPDKAKVIQVIETNLTRRGNGSTTPIRIVRQYWSLNGGFLAEVDPLPERSLAPTPAQLVQGKGLVGHCVEAACARETDFNQWNRSVQEELVEAILKAAAVI